MSYVGKFFRYIKLLTNIKKVYKVASKSAESIQKKLEPMEFGRVVVSDQALDILVASKVVNNQGLGFSTLVLIEEADMAYPMLINNAFVREFLKNKDFVAFREKTLFFFRVCLLGHYLEKEDDIFQTFLKEESLRQNKFAQFRNIVSMNPESNIFRIVRSSNPRNKSIIIVTDEKSLRFVENSYEYVDVLIISENLFSECKKIQHIPRVIRVIEDDSLSNIISAIKVACVDTSYKKDCNLLLPVKSGESNFNCIDDYNKNITIEGLVRYSRNKSINVKNNFRSFIDSIVIEELYLRENIYCCYSDMILRLKTQDDYRKLLMRTLKDGVRYEKI
ncbi:MULTISPECIES: hypothetical protein [unclassified Francisella]|uniref:hypothetical protein n=1 Tax=unclassified Francisella TaxID=2610885 RepID=UPI002E2FF8C4|nr:MULTISPECIES: hypothetical protein [unclassified Francisella]MED7820128.1 hypothetical protein [Francisella sp. 19S2-4]MED7830941.1 hypothetical protein [Francisella sp. 19S2-10]